MIEKQLSGTPIHYWINEKKSSETIIFIHPAFADHTSFDDQIQFFSKDYQVITLDLIGHGKSLKTQKDDDIIKTSEYFNKLLEVESINKTHLVGVSLGALLIQDFANKYPEKVDSLCCIGGYDINNYHAEFHKENTEEQVKMMMKALVSIKWFAKNNKIFSAVTPEAQDKFYQMNVRFKKRSFAYLSKLSKLTNKYKTTNRNYPIMIGCGQYDNPLAIKVAIKWYESEPKSKLVIFENAGHLSNMDKPKDFNINLNRFLTGEL